MIHQTEMVANMIDQAEMIDQAPPHATRHAGFGGLSVSLGFTSL